MGFRFFRRIKIAPGLRVNLSKSGPSLSVGRRGAWYTMGPRGNRATVGLPGTGLYYTKQLGSGKRSPASARAGATPPPSPTVPPGQRLTLGFFQRLVTPKDEQYFVDGCRELFLGNNEVALGHLVRSDAHADAQFLAGYLHLERRQWAEASAAFQGALRQEPHLGRLFGKYGVAPTLSLPITPEYTALIGPDFRGVVLGLVEALQEQGLRDEAIRTLDTLHRRHPGDIVALLSELEFLLDEQSDKADWQRAVKLTATLENDTPAHTVALLHKGMALGRLGLPTAARDAFTAALRRRKDRSPELLRAIRYERALVYGTLGQAARQRTELESIYSEDPAHEDVASRLGLK